MTVQTLYISSEQLYISLQSCKTIFETTCIILRSPLRTCKCAKFYSRHYILETTEVTVPEQWREASLIPRAWQWLQTVILVSPTEQFHAVGTIAIRVIQSGNTGSTAPWDCHSQHLLHQLGANLSQPCNTTIAPTARQASSSYEESSDLYPVGSCFESLLSRNRFFCILPVLLQLKCRRKDFNPTFRRHI
jgi:hypothetical protein